MIRHKSTALFSLSVMLWLAANTLAQQATPNPSNTAKEEYQREVERYFNLWARAEQAGGRGQRGGAPPQPQQRSWLTPNGAWWTNTAMVERLGLTADQKAKIERAFENHRQQIVSSTDLLEKEEAQLAKLLEAESIDRNAVLTQIDRVAQSRSEMERANSAMTLEMREYLTRAQWMQLQPSQSARVGAGILNSSLISQVEPVYPEAAKQAGIQGAVVLEVDISKEGLVENVRVLSGNAPFVQPAIDAVKQWRYRPILLNGEVVSVIGTITVNFPFSARAPGQRSGAPAGAAPGVGGRRGGGQRQQ